MTTESKQDARPGATVLVGAAVGGLIAVVALAGVGYVIDGRPAGLGAFVGGLVALAIFTFGTVTVHVVSGVLPAVSLLMALLTYALQLVLLLVALTALDRAGLVGETLARGWLAAGIIAATFAWMAAQVWRATHLRLPAFETGRTGGEA